MRKNSLSVHAKDKPGPEWDGEVTICVDRNGIFGIVPYSAEWLPELAGFLIFYAQCGA